MTTKIYEKCKIKSLIVEKFKKFLKIKVHGLHKDYTRLSRPAWYSIDHKDVIKWPEEYVEIRDTNDASVKIDEK